MDRGIIMNGGIIMNVPVKTSRREFLGGATAAVFSAVAALGLAAAGHCAGTACRGDTIRLWPEGRVPDCQAGQATPELRVALPERRAADAMLIIAPGGSYRKWCEWESKCADWFNAKWLATAVLRYRTPQNYILESGRSASRWELAMWLLSQFAAAVASPCRQAFRISQ